MSNIVKKIILFILILILAGALGYFLYKSESRLNNNFLNESSFIQKKAFKLGLDLSGGSHLVYEADLSAVEQSEISNSMNSLRDVIERRVNLFGVSEPIVQVKSSSFISGEGEKLIVDLPGVTDVDQAVEMIGQTPFLEFRIEREEEDLQQYLIEEDGEIKIDVRDQFAPTELTGRYLKRSILNFDPNTREPVVSLQFDDEGKKLFADITRENVGKVVAIYLDGAPITTPVVREPILDGEAVITGNFNPKEARELVGRLNSGALPVPIALLSKQTIGATLGESAINSGVKAGTIGFLLIIIYLILIYRLPGLLASVSLSIFVILMLTLFKLIPVTLTAAGIAGFVISIGIAVDANILIFERIKEELRAGRSIAESVALGFERAWTSIRDSNTSTLLASIILFWFGTSLIKGFALTLGLGILTSLFCSLVITKTFLKTFALVKENKITRFLFSSDLETGKIKNNL